MVMGVSAFVRSGIELDRKHHHFYRPLCKLHMFALAEIGRTRKTDLQARGTTRRPAFGLVQWKNIISIFLIRHYYAITIVLF